MQNLENFLVRLPQAPSQLLRHGKDELDRIFGMVLAESIESLPRHAQCPRVPECLDGGTGLAFGIDQSDLTDELPALNPAEQALRRVAVGVTDGMEETVERKIKRIGLFSLLGDEGIFRERDDFGETFVHEERSGFTAYSFGVR